MEEDSEIDLIRKKKLESLKKLIDDKQKMMEIPTVSENLFELNLMNFDQVVMNSNYLLVDCYAIWCAPCRTMNPIIKKLAKEFKGKVAFGKLNTDRNSAIASRYKISGIPCFLLFKDGNFLTKIVGAVGEPGLRRAIQQYFI